MPAPQQLSEEERDDVVELRRQDDVENEAEAPGPDREIREMREEPAEVDDPHNREREVLQHPFGAVADDRHEGERADGPHRRDHEETEAAEVRRHVRGHHRRVHDQHEEPLAIEAGRAREFLEAVYGQDRHE